MDAKATILGQWKSYRDADRLGTLLPRSTPRTWDTDTGPAAIITLDYRVYHDLILGTFTADLVEMYWTVRLKNGLQDPNWAAAINAHVVRVSTDSVSAEDLEATYRHVVMIRRALQQGGIGGLIAEGRPIALHVRGLVLGPALSAPVAIIEGLANYTDVPLTVGRYHLDGDGAIAFAGQSADAKPWEADAASANERISLGQRLLRHDRLMATQGVWAPEVEPKEPKYGRARPEF